MQKKTNKQNKAKEQWKEESKLDFSTLTSKYEILQSESVNETERERARRVTRIEARAAWTGRSGNGNGSASPGRQKPQ